MRRIAGFLLASIAVALAGCGGGASLTSDEPPKAAVAEPGIAELGMDGRWTLAAPNAPTCGMTFTGGPTATEGRVTPDGGCPEQFYMSRRWRLSDAMLTIVDGDNAPLASLRAAGNRFEGRSISETPITLSR
ncbi:MAG: AprI/Inh family metalloprotease inhibitor [Pseudolabrys sp.]